LTGPVVRNDLWLAAGRGASWLRPDWMQSRRQMSAAAAGRRRGRQARLIRSAPLRVLLACLRRPTFFAGSMFTLFAHRQIGRVDARADTQTDVREGRSPDEGLRESWTSIPMITMQHRNLQGVYVPAVWVRCRRLIQTFRVVQTVQFREQQTPRARDGCRTPPRVALAI
jgi:hypothetical protein